MNWQVLTSYSFLVIGTATFLLASCAGMVGSISVLKGQSLIGDAIGHAAYPGIILAFMVMGIKDPIGLLIGALITGTIAFAMIQLIYYYSKVELDAILAVILSSFFGFGMVMKSWIQGNPNYSGESQSGLNNYIFGQAAFIMEQDIYIILIVACVSLCLFFMFYKEFKLFVFDEQYAESIGIHPRVMYFLMMIMTMAIIAVGLKLVGTILIASLIIIPTVAAQQWSDRYGQVILIAGGVGGVSGIIGTYLSTVYRGFSTGPSIIVVMTLIALLSFLVGPRGLVRRKMRRKDVLQWTEQK